MICRIYLLLLIPLLLSVLLEIVELHCSNKVESVVQIRMASSTMDDEQAQAADRKWQGKEEETEVNKMIAALTKHNYRVLTETEFIALSSAKLPLGPPISSSTPSAGAKPKYPYGRGRGARARYISQTEGEDGARLGKLKVKDEAFSESEFTKGDNLTGPVLDISNSASTVRIPKISNFSGQELKGDVSYNVWKYEIRCLMRDSRYSEADILQAVRQSLKGTAREMLIPLGERATGEQILKKLDGLFGNVVSDEVTLQKYYTETQQEGESVTAYACRLETQLQTAIDSGYVVPGSKDAMLRSKFWTSLSERLKTQTRHKYENIKSFDVLVREVRAVEMELGDFDKVKSKKVAQHQPVHIDGNDQKMNLLMSQLETLTEKMKSLETKMDKIGSNKKSNSNFSNNSKGNSRPYGQGSGNSKKTQEDQGQEKTDGKEKFHGKKTQSKE